MNKTSTSTDTIITMSAKGFHLIQASGPKIQGPGVSPQRPHAVQGVCGRVRSILVMVSKCC